MYDWDWYKKNVKFKNRRIQIIFLLVQQTSQALSFHKQHSSKSQFLNYESTVAKVQRNGLRILSVSADTIVNGKPPPLISMVQ